MDSSAAVGVEQTYLVDLFDVTGKGDLAGGRRGVVERRLGRWDKFDGGAQARRGKKRGRVGRVEK